MDFAEKQRRKTLLKTVRQQQREAIRAGLPISPDLMEALFKFVDQKLGMEECDHSVRWTQYFLKEQNLPEGKTLRWMRNAGGYCDCEIVSNAWGVFEDAQTD